MLGSNNIAVLGKLAKSGEQWQSYDDAYMLSRLQWEVSQAQCSHLRGNYTFGFYCVTQICIARTSYGNASGWLAGCLSRLVTHSLVTICGDACSLSCVSAEACFTSWPNAQDRRDGEVN